MIIQPYSPPGLLQSVLSMRFAFDTKTARTGRYAPIEAAWVSALPMRAKLFGVPITTEYSSYAGKTCSAIWRCLRRL